nr:hypothetical protein [Streptococcus infantis]
MITNSSLHTKRSLLKEALPEPSRVGNVLNKLLVRLQKAEMTSLTISRVEDKPAEQ